MPFYPTDNLDTWFRVALEEDFEARDKEEQREWRNTVSVCNIKERCEEYLSNCGVTSATIIDAIMHSVDWDDIFDSHKSDICLSDDATIEAEPVQIPAEEIK